MAVGAIAAIVVIMGVIVGASARSIIGHPAAVRARTKIKGTIRSGIDTAAAKVGFRQVIEDSAVVDGTA